MTIKELDKPGYLDVVLFSGDDMANELVRVYRQDSMDEYLDAFDAKILQIHECIGAYESGELCGHCLVDAACGRITMELQKLEENAGKWVKLGESIEKARNADPPKWWLDDANELAPDYDKIIRAKLFPDVKKVSEV